MSSRLRVGKAGGGSNASEEPKTEEARDLYTE